METILPDLFKGEFDGIFFDAVTGDTVHTLGGGGVSHQLPEVDLRLVPGGVPITN